MTKEITTSTTQEEYEEICQTLRADGITLMPDSPSVLAENERHEDNVREVRAIEDGLNAEAAARSLSTEGAGELYLGEITGERYNEIVLGNQ